MQFMERYLEDTLDLGTDRMILAPGWGYVDAPEEEAFARSVEAIRRLAEKAAALGVKLSVEEMDPLSTLLVRDLPHLKKLEEEMKGKEVVFIGVSVDEEKNYDKWKKFITDEQLPGIQLFANGWSKITKDYKITGIPRFMVFDREGKVVESVAPRPSNPDLKALLEEELRK